MEDGRARGRKGSRRRGRDGFSGIGWENLREEMKFKLFATSEKVMEIPE